MTSSRVTVHDVARLAGLSSASVSRALSGARPVSNEVAERVSRAAEQLGYRPDSVARSLRLQSTRTFGLVVADITNPFFPLLVQAVEQASRRAGFSLLLADAQGDVEVERESIDILLDNRVDGLLISPSHRFLSIPAMAKAKESIPVVQLDRVADLEGSFVRVDQARSIEQLLDHLRSRGYRRFGFIGSDPSISTSRDREEAFVAQVAADDPAAAVRVLVGDFTVEWGRIAARKMMSIWPEVDAIVCANDLIALGAQQALGEDSIRVPGEVAITGFDDTIIASAVGITSVRQPFEDLAANALEICVNAHKDPEAPIRQVNLDAVLEVRGSTG